jgi:sugar/nucleoside kinase (ribokinase family)
VTGLAVIGNISRDRAVYADGRRFEFLGGAALHVAWAASRAGLVSAPVSVIGADLGWIYADPRLADIDLTHVKTVSGASCAFALTYTAGGKLARIDCSFGAAESLTSHCLAVIGQHSSYHVCCRRPLDVPAVLGRLARDGLEFSADFHLASAADLIAAAVPFLPHAAAVFVNAAEFATLKILIDPVHVAAVVVSDGPREATLLRHGNPTAAIRPPDSCPVEVTGAGDTLAGTFLAGIARGLGDEDALRAGVTAASQSVRAPGLAINGS